MLNSSHFWFPGFDQLNSGSFLLLVEMNATIENALCTRQQLTPIMNRPAPNRSASNFKSSNCLLNHHHPIPYTQQYMFHPFIITHMFIKSCNGFGTFIFDLIL